MQAGKVVKGVVWLYGDTGKRFSVILWHNAEGITKFGKLDNFPERQVLCTTLYIALLNMPGQIITSLSCVAPPC